MDASNAIESLTALAQPTRLSAFRFLLGRREPVAAGTIAGHCGVPHNTMSTHLAILVRAGLLTVEREGRSKLYSADLDGFRSLVAFLAHDCCNGRPEICAPILASVSACNCAPESANGC